jgi:dinuclear metal center YbgI/SA1388 family protein
MKIEEVISLIEEIAPLSLQESYDNAGLLVGDKSKIISGVLISIDVTEDVVSEAIKKNCNLIISHHPIIFGGLKRLVGDDYVQRTVIKAIKNDIAIYAAHTNIDNVLINGVNGKIAEKLDLKNTSVLKPKSGELLKLITFVPNNVTKNVLDALFEAGAGQIGNYDKCSYSTQGIGTFRGNKQSNPYVGEKGKLHSESETKIEVIVPKFLKNRVVSALKKAHPYEEPAFDLIPLLNDWNTIGAGVIGDLDNETDELTFLENLKTVFQVKTIRHTNFIGKKIKKVAVCGGAGSSFLQDAIRAKADVFISGDFKYHEFFDTNNEIIIADIGHFESEQYTKDIFYEIISKKIPNFAVQISEVKTNPINYL